MVMMITMMMFVWLVWCLLGILVISGLPPANRLSGVHSRTLLYNDPDHLEDNDDDEDVNGVGDWEDGDDDDAK